MRTRCTALRRPLPRGTVAALLDDAASRARAAVRDYARALAPVLPTLGMDAHGWLTPAEAAAAAAAQAEAAEAVAAAGGISQEAAGRLPLNRAGSNRPRETAVMVEVPPSEWALAERVHSRWRLSGGRAAAGSSGEWRATWGDVAGVRQQLEALLTSYCPVQGLELAWQHAAAWQLPAAAGAFKAEWERWLGQQAREVRAVVASAGGRKQGGAGKAAGVIGGRPGGSQQQKQRQDKSKAKQQQRRQQKQQERQQQLERAPSPGHTPVVLRRSARLSKGDEGTPGDSGAPSLSKPAAGGSTGPGSGKQSKRQQKGGKGSRERAPRRTSNASSGSEWGESVADDESSASSGTDSGGSSESSGGSGSQQQRKRKQPARRGKRILGRLLLPEIPVLQPAEGAGFDDGSSLGRLGASRWWREVDPGLLVGGRVQVLTHSRSGNSKWQPWQPCQGRAAPQAPRATAAAEGTAAAAAAARAAAPQPVVEGLPACVRNVLSDAQSLGVSDQVLQRAAERLRRLLGPQTVGTEH